MNIADLHPRPLTWTGLRSRWRSRWATTRTGSSSGSTPGVWTTARFQMLEELPSTKIRLIDCSNHSLVSYTVDIKNYFKHLIKDLCIYYTCTIVFNWWNKLTEDAFSYWWSFYFMIMTIAWSTIVVKVKYFSIPEHEVNYCNQRF